MPYTASVMSKIAVIETGGKQYVVKEDDVLSVEKIAGDNKPGSKLTFDKVLLVDDGKAAKVGSPHVAGSKVEAELMENGLGKKVHVIRFKSKSRYFKKKGHRQPYTKVKITKIN
jgi:large subunit ribosomal protein L21